MAILGELAREDLLHGETATCTRSLAQALAHWDVRAADLRSENLSCRARGRAHGRAFSQDKRFDEDFDRKTGDPQYEHAYSQDGGLAVFYGNLAEDGCIVKTAGVDAIYSSFPAAVVFESQEAAVEAILRGWVSPGDVVVIRYEGPRGGPGMQEMPYPTSYLNPKG